MIKKYRKTFTPEAMRIMPDTEESEVLSFLSVGEKENQWIAHKDRQDNSYSFFPKKTGRFAYKDSVSVECWDWILKAKGGRVYFVPNKEFRETYEECE